MVPIKNLPVKTKRLLGLGIILALVVALPLFIWAIITQRFDVRERAQVATGEPLCPLVEACPVVGQLDLLRNCTPPEIDGTPQESLCNQPGRVESCGGVTFCCPSAGGAWTTNLSSCPLPAITPTPRATASPMPTGYDARKPLLFKVRFEGVSDGAADGAKATIRFVSGNYINVITNNPVSFWHVGGGVYEALIWPFDEFYLPMWGDGNGYTIFVKGEKHYANKFCSMIGQIGPCKGVGNIPIPEVTAPPYSLYDFTGYPLQPGDLPVQDGNADMQDFARISDLTYKLCADLTSDERARADLDYNGCVNTKDLFLMRKTLETKSDEY